MQTKMKGINEFFLSRMDGMNEVKFNAECSPDLLLTALGYPCIRQAGETKYYRVTNSAGKVYAFTVNTVNNTWLSKDNKRGRTTDLLRYMDYLHLSPTDNCTAETCLLNSLYKDLMCFDYRIACNDNPIDISRFDRVNLTVCNKDSIAVLARHGISMKAAELAKLRELVLSSSQGSKERHLLALPTDNGCMTVFDGKEIRPFLNTGISIIPAKCKTLYYKIFENMMDYLAYVELDSRRSWQMMGISTAIILNGEDNIEDVISFFKKNKGVEAIQCYFTDDIRGNNLYRYLAREVGRRFIRNKSEEFFPFRSLSETVRTKVPTIVIKQLVKWKKTA